MTEIQRINQRLAKEHRTLGGTPLFQVVWSEDTFEYRHGVFRDFSPEGIFLREVTETRLTKKYPFLIDRYIFEMWAPGNITANPETPCADKGDYLPVYPFESGAGIALPVTDKVVDFIVSVLRGKVRKDQVPSEEYIEAKEIENEVISMETHPDWFQTAAGEGRNAIGYTKELGEKT